jgi:GT2 family glycosyltransferase
MTIAAAEIGISVLIVNYNSGDRLPRVLAALAAQDHHPFEVVVVDNASSDGSHDVAAPEGLDLRVVRLDTNTGFAGGVMAAAGHARHPWLAFLNPDAYPTRHWLHSLAHAAREYGSTAALSSVQLMAADTDRLDGLGDVYHASGVAWRGGFGKSVNLRPDHDGEVFAPCFAAAMVHAETFRRNGGLDTDFFCYHEDVDYGFRHRLYGGRTILVSRAEVLHEGSAITGRYSEFTVFHGIRNRLWTFAKNMPLPLLPVTVPAYVLFSLAFLLRSFMLGIGRPYMRGVAAGLRGLGPQLVKRRLIQRERNVSLWQIAKAISWSPIAPFRRAPRVTPLRSSDGEAR